MPPPESRFRLRLWLYAAALLVLVNGIAAYDVWRMRRDAEEATRLRAANVTHAMAQHVRRSLQAVSLAMEGMGQAIARLPEGQRASPREVEKLLLDRGAGFTKFLSLAYFDARGIGIAASERGFGQGQSFADREYFRVHLNRPDSGLYVGGPLLGRTFGKRFFPMSRAVRDGKGRFLGVIMGSIEAGDYAETFAGFHLGPNGAISLLHETGKVISRSPDFAKHFGQDISGGPLFEVHLPRAAVGQYEAHLATDGMRRLVHYRRIEGLPLIAAVGFAREDLEAELRGGVWARVGLAGLLSLLILGGAALLLRDQRLCLEVARTQKDLGVAQKVTRELEAANRELESFSYSVSHDLRAPLRAINGYSHLLLEHPERFSGEERQMLERITANSSRLGELIDDILEYSRAGRSTLNWARADMTALVRSVIDEMKEQYPSARIIIGPLPAAAGDAIMLRQVWHNLIGNALKFSAKRERPELRIGACVGEAEISFHVQDNGCGFDMRYADKLFGMFQRMHSADEFPGTGVGLAIVKRLVERHGGRVWVQSAPDQGTTVSFTLGPAPERAA